MSLLDIYLAARDAARAGEKELHIRASEWAQVRQRYVELTGNTGDPILAGVKIVTIADMVPA